MRLKLPVISAEPTVEVPQVRVPGWGYPTGWPERACVWPERAVREVVALVAEISWALAVLGPRVGFRVGLTVGFNGLRDGNMVGLVLGGAGEAEGAPVGVLVTGDAEGKLVAPGVVGAMVGGGVSAIVGPWEGVLEGSPRFVGDALGRLAQVVQPEAVVLGEPTFATYWPATFPAGPYWHASKTLFPPA